METEITNKSVKRTSHNARDAKRNGITVFTDVENVHGIFGLRFVSYATRTLFSNTGNGNVVIIHVWKQ